jgi:hypothetical protein
MSSFSPALESALDRHAIVTVVAAASQGRTAVVQHQFPVDAVGDAAAMKELSTSMPAGWIRGLDGAVDTVSRGHPAELGAVLPVDRAAPTVTRLYHVQHAVRSLTDAVFAGLEDAWPVDERWLDRDAGFFVSSAGAVTPAHADRHHNLLLQLSGAKEIAVCVPGSKAHAAVLARSVPSFHVDEMPVGAEVITLNTGAALYMPPYTVHWVRSTDDSVALSCGWSSDATVRAGEVHFANATLRRFGLPAQPVGRRFETARLRAAGCSRRVRALVRPSTRRNAAER